MAVRFRKYFKQCKGKRSEGDMHGKVIVRGIDCEGRRGRHCPAGVPSPCGAWALDFRHPDGRWLSKIYPEIRTKTEAEHFLAIIKTDILRKKFNLPCEKAIPTLKEYSNQYLEISKNSKENTFVAKKRAVNILVEHLGDYRIDKLNDVVVEKFIIKRQDAGIRPGSINEDIAKLKHLLRAACKAGILNSIPCKGVRKLKVSEKKDRVLSSEEITHILNGDGLKTKDRLMILVSLFAGMRLNEVLLLRWDNIDFPKSLVSFVQSKTGKMIIVPLSSYLAGELLAYKAASQVGGIFENKPINRGVANAYSRYFGRVFKRLGFLNCSFHSLRHTFLSRLGDLGTGAFITKELAGHSTIDMTMRYTHINLDSKKKAIALYTECILNNTNRVVPLKVQTG